MKNKIIISVSSDLSTDQRVLKVANTCFNNGFDVLLIGRLLKNSQSLNLPFPFKRMKLFFNSSALFYVELNFRLFIYLLFHHSDIMLANDTDTLLANYYVSKLKRKKLVFDAHELFPEIPELVNRPFVRKCWEKIENNIIPKVKLSYTVCNSIAEYYAKKYNIKMEVVRNVPNYMSFNEKKIKYEGKKIILYQGALNVGRGLEWVLDAMPYINDAVVVIIGDGDIRDQLEEKTKELNIENKVKFFGKISGTELYKYTPSADIGLCLLDDKGLSYNFALPNRIFDYLHAGVPVLATDFKEISQIVTTFKTGKLINHYEPEYLAKIINSMLQDPFDTKHFKKTAKNLCWENEEKVILNLLIDK